MKIAAMVAIYLIGTAQLFPLYAKGAEDRVVAQVRLGESDSYEYKNLLLGTNSQQSAYWIAGQRARLSAPQQTQSAFLWRISSDGKLQEIDIAKSLRDFKAVDSEITGLNVLNNGSVLFVIHGQAFSPAVVHLDAEGKTIFTKKLEDAGPPMEAKKIMASKDDGFYAIGAQGPSGVVAKFENEHLVWKKNVTTTPYKNVIDAFQDTAGGLFVVSVTYGEDGVTPSSSRITRLSSAGEVIAQVVFSGAYLSATIASDGTVIATYNRGTFEAQDVWIKEFSSKLAEIRTFQLMHGGISYAFHSMFNPPDNLLICGTKNTSLWVAAFSLLGAKRWVVEGEEDDVFPCEQAGLSKDGMVVVSGITKVVDKEHVLTKVGVRRLKVD